MVCVVNLISPDGRYDANFLDNYGQIYVADVLKRIPGVSDVIDLRPQVRDADLDRPRPPRQHADRPAPRSSPPSSKRTSRPPPARSAASRSPKARRFEFPLTVKGRLSRAAEFEEIIVRRNNDGSIVRFKDVARVELSLRELRDLRLPRRQARRRHAGLSVLRRQRPRHRRAGPRRDGAAQDDVPRGPRLRDRLRHDQVRRGEHRRGRAHAARSLRAGHDRGLRLPPGLPRHDHPDDLDPGLADRHVRG